MDVADHLSRKGFATTSQHIDVTKPAPVRLDIEFEAASSCFKCFHKEFMEKAVGRKGGKKPGDGKKPTINAAVTKQDLKLFGKETVEGVAKATQK